MKLIIILKKLINALSLLTTKSISEYPLHKTSKKILITNCRKYREHIPKTVWMYWHDETIPPLVSACIARIKTLNKEHVVNLVNNNNYKEYLPELYFPNEKISVQLRADIIRLELIYKFGGIWVDASIMFFEDFSWITKISEECKYDFIGFYRERLTNNRERPVIENWMFCAPPKNMFIKIWLETLRPAIHYGLDEYHKSLTYRKDYNEIKQNINIPVYLSAYLAAQIAAKKYSQLNAYLQCAESTAYYYHEKYPQKDFIFEKVWCRYEKPKCLPPLIKLTSQNRHTIEKCDAISPKSIFGKFREFSKGY
ncbi:capsular polysaccharide synthesis protein [Escherichia coli]|uniref:capsular polysaccharide synthesis protein n=1 Tax=Escherichia coli TaxID=562 RepID=UPI003F8BD9AA